MVIFHTRGGTVVRSASPASFAELVPRSVWIDLLAPSREEELALEAALGFGIPTREEMTQIELSRRFYAERDVVYMTVFILARAETPRPESTPVTFILTPERLVTVRYADPGGFRVFTARREAHPTEGDTAPGVFCGLVDATVERLADILEESGAGIEQLSLDVFRAETDEPPSRGAAGQRTGRPAQREYKDILRRIGHANDVVTRVLESLVSMTRLITFFRARYRQELRMRETVAHLKAVGADLRALEDHATFLSSKVAFLLDATLGHINNEQNAIIKIVSVAAVVFLPPTLVASIYGMNFLRMPELGWAGGYPMALALMVISAVLPYLVFKRKGWL